MYRICRRFGFSASHQLAGLPEGHPCGRLHGHNWSVEVLLQGEHVDRVGFVRDFADLDTMARFIQERLDHRHLNEIVSGNPTSENVAAWLYSLWKPEFPEMITVRVSEISGSWAEFSD